MISLSEYLELQSKESKSTSAITKFEKWILRRIFERIVKQSNKHKSNIETVYKLIREATENEFVEDNAPTLDCFLKECFETSQRTKIS